MYGSINPFEVDSTKDLVRNGKKDYDTAVVTIAEVTLLRKLKHKDLASVFTVQPQILARGSGLWLSPPQLGKVGWCHWQ